MKKPKRLKIENINGKLYFVDERLKEYRNIHNPHDTISFDEELIYLRLKK